MQYRLNKDYLLNVLRSWDGFLKKRVQLIACGGTAMTLLGVKDSTADIDLLIPEDRQYLYLISILEDIGYKKIHSTRWAGKDMFVFDLYPGKTIFQTELLESPLKKGNSTVLHEFKYISLGVLNCYDLIISKIFRCSSVDMEDCLILIKNRKNDIYFKKLKDRYYETSSYSVSDEQNKRNFELFQKYLKKKEVNI